jgi:hypothetical protein
MAERMARSGGPDALARIVDDLVASPSAASLAREPEMAR